MITTAFFALGSLLSIWMVVQSIIWLSKAARCKTILDVPLLAGIKRLDITESGLYAVKILGASRLAVSPNVTVKGVGPTVNVIKQWRPLIPFRGKSPGRRTVELLCFTIDRPGEYSLVVGQVSSVRAHASQLRLLGAVDSVDPEKLDLRIAQTIPSWKRLFSIIFLAIGLNGIGWCTLFLLWPDAFR
jgi:hypothetical protein